MSDAQLALETVLNTEVGELLRTIRTLSDDAELRKVLYVLAGLARVYFDVLEARPPADFAGNGRLHRELQVRRIVDDCLQALGSRVIQV